MLKKILIKYRRSLIVFTHLLLVTLSYWLAFCLRFDFNIPGFYWLIFIKTLPLAILIKMMVFHYQGIYYGLWRYVSIGDLWQIIKASSVSTAVFVFTVLFLNGFSRFPRSVFFLDWLLCVTLISGIRLVTRFFREQFRPLISTKKRRILIVGAGQAGVLMLNECRSNPTMDMSVMGFIDDDPLKKNQSIGGVKILGNRKDIPLVSEKNRIEEIILAIPSAKGEVVRDILKYCQIPYTKIKIIPGMDKILNGELLIKARSVEPDDLLGRETVKIDEEEVRGYIRNKKVLITGAGGSIGSEISRQLAKFSPREILLLDHNENEVYFLVVELKTKYPNIKFRTIIGDIKDVGLLKHVFSSYRPQVVFHAAAHKHVPLMEENPVSAVKNNVIASRNIIYASEHYKVERFIFISTDKAVNPVNVMGKSKRLVEMIIQAKAPKSKTKFMAVRFGNVLGSAGSVVPLFKRQIENGGPVTVTHPDARRYFMSIKEAVSLVLQAAAFGKGGEIFILDMGEQVKIVDIAHNLIVLSGLKMEKDISIKFIGLRKGEKLFEEILLHTEKEKVTKNEKIYITQPNSFDAAKLRLQIKELGRYANLMDAENTVRKLQEIVHN